MADAGYAEIGKDDWIGVFVPAGTPNAIVATLNNSLRTIITQPDTVERMATLGFEPVVSTPEEFSTRIKVEIESWGRMIRAANIRAE